MPSRPILTTPARSENKPPSPASAIGTESKSAADAVPTLVNSEALVSMRIIVRVKTKSMAYRNVFIVVLFMHRPPLQVQYFAALFCIDEQLHRQ